MPSDFSLKSPAQIPFQFDGFQENDLDSFLPGQNQELLKIVNFISNKAQTQHLYLWGESNTGKTHLLQAACKQAAENDLHVAYIPLRQIEELNAKILHDLGELDLVCVDDLDGVSGHVEWQQGLVWLYNELRDNNHSMMISGNKSPAHVVLEVADLKSRLGWDQTAQIKPADDDLKKEILKQKARARSFELSDELIEFLIRRLDRDLGSLMKVLDKIDHASLAEKRKITIPFVKELIRF